MEKFTSKRIYDYNLEELPNDSETWEGSGNEKEIRPVIKLEASNNFEFLFVDLLRNMDKYCNKAEESFEYIVEEDLYKNRHEK